MRKCIASFSELGSSRLCGWIPSTTWLGTLRDVVSNRERCWSCSHFLLNWDDWEEVCVREVGRCIPCVGYYGILFSSHPCRPIPYPSCWFIISIVTCDMVRKIAISWLILMFSGEPSWSYWRSYQTSPVRQKSNCENVDGGHSQIIKSRAEWRLNAISRRLCTPSLLIRIWQHR